ncbi:MAG TPA: VWA domain-containing protein [Leptolyngbyaceae cyanobacterium]
MAKLLQKLKTLGWTWDLWTRLERQGSDLRKIMMSDRDYTLIIDKSGSMSTPDQVGGRSRWEIAQESTLALARKAEQFDPDGITVYVFSGRFKRYEDVTSAKVAQIFLENDPAGTTNLAGVLQDALNNYFQRKAAGKTKANGETILVITDGEPDDRKAVFETIIHATRQMERDEELGISIIQVGSDPQATKFLKALDDQLQGVGAKFDICDTITLDDLEDMSLADVLMNAVND